MPDDDVVPTVATRRDRCYFCLSQKLPFGHPAAPPSGVGRGCSEGVRRGVNHYLLQGVMASTGFARTMNSRPPPSPADIHVHAGGGRMILVEDRDDRRGCLREEHVAQSSSSAV